MRRNRRKFPKLAWTTYAIIAGLAVLYFLLQEKLWTAAYAALSTVLAILVVLAIFIPLLWYLVNVVGVALWRARRLRMLRYRRALRDINYRND
ncbi:MAG TPA: hypothetical protein VN577_14975 [Terriglobales bacterium]|nr:hypothetical protein [Terriglobales bacterium]